MKEKIITKLSSRLLKSKQTISIAESCTGGLASKLVTDIPGSSCYFKLGVVAYSNQAKCDILGIPFSILLKFQAVSKQTAKAMAESARKLGKSNIGVGITGIAGPAGATKTKPVGTVFIAISKTNKKYCQKFKFSGSRKTIRNKSALKALELLNKAF